MSVKETPLTNYILCTTVAFSINIYIYIVRVKNFTVGWKF